MDFADVKIGQKFVYVGEVDRQGSEGKVNVYVKCTNRLEYNAFSIHDGLKHTFDRGNKVVLVRV